MVLRLISRSPRRPALLSPSSANMVRQGPGWVCAPPQDLTPAWGRQNHTTSPSASAPFVCAPVTAHGKPALPSRRARGGCRVHRIPPRVRDDRDTPLKWDETVRISELICLGPKQKYFCKRGWTSHFGKHEVICPSGKIATLARLASYPSRQPIPCTRL